MKRAGVCLLVVVVACVVAPVFGEIEPRRIVEVTGYTDLDERPGWRVVQAPKSVHGAPGKVRLFFGLSLQNVAELERELNEELANPRSARYGEWLSAPEVLRRLRPEPHAAALVEALVLRHGGEVVFGRNPGWVIADLPVFHASKLLQCPLRLYEHVPSGTYLWRCNAAETRYSLPANVADVVDFVGGVHSLPPWGLSMRTPKGSTPSSESIIVTPAAIREFYNVDDTMGLLDASPMHIGVHEFEKQFYKPDDLTLFQQRNGLPIQPVSRQLGPNHEGTVASGEGSLDIQFLMGMAPNVTSTYLYFPGGENQYSDPFLFWMATLLLIPDPPYVNSVSYGDNGFALSPLYMQRVSTEIMAFTATGRTMFFSSGDYGVNCRPLRHKFVTHFPACSPYVTSVGGTVLYVDDNGVPDPTETGISFSGGGFSFVFDRPHYQDQAVETYLHKYEQPADLFYNPNGRAYPDLALFATNFEIIENGNPDYIGGTSASTPAIAGLFSLINELRFEKNLPSLGFLNPTLYHLKDTRPDVYNDITSGNNAYPPCPGFTCEPGFDALSGLGSINWANMRDALVF
mmetsp:Transcript_32475/g.90931  ORF Transcript_32475/g.90931 Transcript_32475/m.90931 type:complete len:572 (+) Transcript_32475:43-1758(+)